MATEVDDRFYTGRTVLTEAQVGELERILAYHDTHGLLCYGPLASWTMDVVTFMRDLLPEGSAYKPEVES